MATPARTIPTLLAAPAALLLAGCSALGVFDDTETDIDDFDDYPEPIAYVDGSATLRLTGGSQTEWSCPSRSAAHGRPGVRAHPTRSGSEPTRGRSS